MREPREQAGGGEGRAKRRRGGAVGPRGHGKNRTLLNSDEGSPPRAGNGGQTGQRGRCGGGAVRRPGPGTAAQAGTRLSCDFSPERVSRKTLGGTGPCEGFVTLSCYFDLSGLHLFHLRTEAGVRSHLPGFRRGSGEAACSEHVACALGRDWLSAVLSDVVSRPAPASLSAFRPVGERSTAGTGCWGAAGMSV